MDNNTCRVIFTDTTHTLWCFAKAEFVRVGLDLNETGNNVITCNRHPASIKAEYIPSKQLGILTLECSEIYDEDAVVGKGFTREEVVTGMATEAMLIRRAIQHFDEFVEVLNRMSPHDQSEEGEVLPASVRKQAA